MSPLGWGWRRGEDGVLRYVDRAGVERAEQWPFEGMGAAMEKESENDEQRMETD